MERPCTISLRLPQELADRAAQQADALGISFSDFVVHALDLALGGEGDGSISLLRKLAAWTEATYDHRSFPEDVTLQVFHHLRDTPEVRAEYDRLVLAEDGSRSRMGTGSLHRRIGLMVKRVLDADVKGRSLLLDPDEHLICSHALLVPKRTTR